jgi:hypothetical protein
MNILKCVENISLCSTALYISRIVYSNPYYVPDVYYLCPDPHVFRTRCQMINMCEKSEQEPKIPGAESVVYFLWTAIVRKMMRLTR